MRYPSAGIPQLLRSTAGHSSPPAPAAPAPPAPGCPAAAAGRSCPGCMPGWGVPGWAAPSAAAAGRGCTGSCPGEAAPLLRGGSQQTVHAGASHTGHSSLLAPASTSAGISRGGSERRSCCGQQGVCREVSSLTCLHAGCSSLSGSERLQQLARFKSSCPEGTGGYSVETEQQDWQTCWRLYHGLQTSVEPASKREDQTPRCDTPTCFSPIAQWPQSWQAATSGAGLPRHQRAGMQASYCPRPPGAPAAARWPQLWRWRLRPAHLRPPATLPRPAQLPECRPATHGWAGLEQGGLGAAVPPLQGLAVQQGHFPSAGWQLVQLKLAPGLGRCCPAQAAADQEAGRGR